jgi:hypothetical protein
MTNRNQETEPKNQAGKSENRPEQKQKDFVPRPEGGGQPSGDREKRAQEGPGRSGQQGQPSKEKGRDQR